MGWGTGLHCSTTVTGVIYLVNEFEGNRNLFMYKTITLKKLYKSLNSNVGNSEHDILITMVIMLIMQHAEKYWNFRDTKLKPERNHVVGYLREFWRQAARRSCRSWWNRSTLWWPRRRRTGNTRFRVCRVRWSFRTRRTCYKSPPSIRNTKR